MCQFHDFVSKIYESIEPLNGVTDEHITVLIRSFPIRTRNKKTTEQKKRANVFTASNKSSDKRSKSELCACAHLVVQ